MNNKIRTVMFRPPVRITEDGSEEMFPEDVFWELDVDESTKPVTVIAMRHPGPNGKWIEYEQHDGEFVNPHEVDWPKADPTSETENQ